jgi:hypothetical protein
MGDAVTDDELADIYFMAYGADRGNPEDRARRRQLMRPLVSALAAYVRDDGTFATFRAGRQHIPRADESRERARPLGEAGRPGEFETELPTGVECEIRARFPLTRVGALRSSRLAAAGLTSRPRRP